MAKSNIIYQSRETIEARERGIGEWTQYDAMITIKDLWLGGKLKDSNPLVVWLLAELLVIATGKKEAKGETTKTDKGGQEAQSELTDRQDSGEAIKTPGELLNWIMKQDPNIKAPRVWVQTEFGLDDKVVLTDKKVMELHKTIREKMGW